MKRHLPYIDSRAKPRGVQRKSELKKVDTTTHRLYNSKACTHNWNLDYAGESKDSEGGGVKIETDVSTEKKTEKKRARLQKADEHKKWQKCFEKKATEGEKSADSIETAVVVFLFNERRGARGQYA